MFKITLEATVDDLSIIPLLEKYVENVSIERVELTDTPTTENEKSTLDEGEDIPELDKSFLCPFTGTVMKVSELTNSAVETLAIHALSKMNSPYGNTIDLGTMKAIIKQNILDNTGIIIG